MTVLDDNRALVRRLVEIVNARDLDAIGQIATGEIAREAARWIGPFTASFPDLRMEVVDDNLTRMRQLGLVE